MEGCGLRGNCARLYSPCSVLVFFSFDHSFGVEYYMSLRCGDDSYRFAGEEGCCSIRSDECLDSFGSLHQCEKFPDSLASFRTVWKVKSLYISAFTGFYRTQV